MPSTSRRFISDSPARRGRWAVALGLGALMVLAALSISYGRRAAAGPREATMHVVLIENMRFSPDVLSVQRGDRIVFKNGDLFPHTATSTAPHGFDSGMVESGKSWSFACERVGEFAYHCTFHPTMTGKIIVVRRK